MQQLSTTPPLRILMASAGSGKTFALTVHFLRLVLANPSSYKEILAITFTNKATAEMKKRILDTLEAIAVDPTQPKAKAYVAELETHFPDWSLAQYQQGAHQAYRKILHDYGRLSIMTIDKFSQQIIRSFTFELGLDPGYRVEINYDIIIPDLIQRLYEQLDTNPTLFDWLLQHLLSLIEQDKSWNINATLSSLAKNTIFNDHFKRWEAQLAEKGADELLAQIAKDIDQRIQVFEKKVDEAIQFVSERYNAFGLGNDHFKRKSQNYLVNFKDPSIIWDKGLSSLCEKLPNFIDNIDAYNDKIPSGSPVPAFYKAINPVLSDLNTFLSANFKEYQLYLAVQKNLPYLKLMRDLALLMAEWRADNGAQVLADAQLLLSKIGQTTAGDPTFIWEKIGNRYKYFLFDEFQDTSHAQWNNLSPLLMNALGERHGNDPAHLIVGDVKQSIYRWRDGDFRILLEGVEKRVKQAFGVKDTGEFLSKENLEHNYRSSKNIIDFNNFLFQRAPKLAQAAINNRLSTKNQGQYPNFWKAEQFDSLIDRAYAEVEQVYPARNNSQKGEDGVIDVQFLKVGNSIKEKFEDVATIQSLDQIQDWISKGGFRAEDVGVLVRTNDEARFLIKEFEKIKKDKGYVYDIVSGEALLLSSDPLVSTLISAMRFLVFEGKAYNTYLAEVVLYYSRFKNIQVAEDSWIHVGQGDIKKLSAVLPENICSQWDALKQLPLTILVEQLIRDFEFEEAGESLTYLYAFVDVVEQYSASQSGDVLAFLEFWDARNEKFSLSGSVQQHAVEVTTVHKSKGLEYEALIIPFCEWNLSGKPREQVWFDVSESSVLKDLGTAPLQFSDAKDTLIEDQYFEEELYNYMDTLNTLYVATTRAKQALCIFAPHKNSYEESSTSSDKSSNKKSSSSSKSAKEDIKDVGDLLYQVVKAHSNWDSESCSLLIGAGGQTDSKDQSVHQSAEEANFDPAFEMKGYPSSTLLQALLAKKSTLDFTRKEMNRASAQFSSNLHELMATIQQEEEGSTAIANFEQAGRLNAEEAKQASRLIQQAWSHPILGNLLKRGYRQGNEKAIIDELGNTWRPDKVLFGPNETIVIDFKLTATVRESAHVSQIQQYMRFLESMQLPHVRGYLYYFLQNEMEEIQ